MIKIQSVRRTCPMVAEVFMTRDGSVAEVVEGLIQRTTAAVDAALYRFNNPRLWRALQHAARRGVKVRLVVDQSKYKDDQVTRALLSSAQIPFRPLSGRLGPGSKMHHKFIILDNHSVLTGSYNWTLESEEENHDNLVFLHAQEQVEVYRREFESLWSEGP